MKKSRLTLEQRLHLYKVALHGLLAGSQSAVCILMHEEFDRMNWDWDVPGPDYLLYCEGDEDFPELWAKRTTGINRSDINNEHWFHSQEERIQVLKEIIHKLQK